MKISVTQDHIDHGKCNNTRACAVALALTDAGLRDVTVYGNAGFNYSDSFGIRHERSLPRNVVQFISDFDTDKSLVAPFDFEVSV